LREKYNWFYLLRALRFGHGALHALRIMHTSGCITDVSRVHKKRPLRLMRTNFTPCVACVTYVSRTWKTRLLSTLDSLISASGDRQTLIDVFDRLRACDIGRTSTHDGKTKSYYYYLLLLLLLLLLFALGSKDPEG